MKDYARLLKRAQELEDQIQGWVKALSGNCLNKSAQQYGEEAEVIHSLIEAVTELSTSGQVEIDSLERIIKRNADTFARKYADLERTLIEERYAAG